MAQNTYIGISDKAKELSNAFIGIDGKARQITAIYIGDKNGKAQLCWSAGGLPGLYKDDELIVSWKDMKKADCCHIDEDSQYVRSTFAHDIASNATWQTANKLIIPSNVTKIGRYAFYYDETPIQINWPRSHITTFGEQAFRSSKVINFQGNVYEDAFPETLQVINTRCFQGITGMTHVSLPKNLTTIGFAAFGFCSNLKTVNIPSSVMFIGPGAFPGSPIVKFTVDANNKYFINYNDDLYSKSYKTLNCYAAGKSNTSISLHSNTTILAQCSFYGASNLTQLNIPSGVQEIHAEAFEKCTNAKILTIPSTVTSISEDWVFCSCDSLYKITVDSQNSKFKTDINECSLYDTNGVFYKYAPASSRTTYGLDSTVTKIIGEAFMNAKNLTSILITGNSGNLAILDRAFYGCEKLQSIPLNKRTITDLGEEAFRETRLTSLNLSNTTVTELPNYLCAKCQQLQSIQFADTIKTIGQHSFRECISLTSIQFPSALEDIGYAAFTGCNSLTSIDFSKCTNLKSINSSAFSGCDSLATIDFSGCTALYSIGSDAFKNCPIVTLDFSGCTSLKLSGYAFQNITTLKHVDLGGTTMTQLLDFSFSGCTALETIILPSSMATIFGNAFKNCSKLTTVYFTGTQSQWDKIRIIDEGNNYLKNATIICNYVD